MEITQAKNQMALVQRAVDAGHDSPRGRKRPTDTTVLSKQEDNIDRAAPNQKRARGACASAVVVPRLPEEVLAQIFSQLGVQSLGRVMQVCRSWRSIVDDHEVWKQLCERIGLLNSHKLIPAKHMIERGTKLNTKVQGCPRGSSRREKWQRKATAAYQMHYKKYRKRVCAHCGNVGVRTVAYELFDRIPICNPCRRLEPFAYISLTHARKYFKYGKVAVEAPGQILPSAAVQFLHRWGTIFRFTDIVKLSEIAIGPERTAEKAMRARLELGIFKMEAAELKDV